MKRAFCVLVTVLALAWMTAQAADSTQITGYISDSACGAKHLGDNVACVKGCISHGEKPVFVDQAKKQVWKIDNPDSVKDFYGAKVVVSATSDAASMSVHIDSIAAAK
ncbi:MAG TPA: hypothetical protein VME23_10535 [Terracidiphilus sp.]|nr:hypothetical protein [Terracidiphilus sp.]